MFDPLRMVLYLVLGIIAIMIAGAGILLMLDSIWQLLNPKKTAKEKSRARFRVKIARGKFWPQERVNWLSRYGFLGSNGRKWWLLTSYADTLKEPIPLTTRTLDYAKAARFDTREEAEAFIERLLNNVEKYDREIEERNRRIREGL